jgi:hypothetical protein
MYVGLSTGRGADETLAMGWPMTGQEPHAVQVD